MSRHSRQLAPNPRIREHAEAIARAAGAMGAPRIPDEALFAGGCDPSDTEIHSLLVAFEAGQLERLARQSDPGYRAAVADELLQMPEAVTNTGDAR